MSKHLVSVLSVLLSLFLILSLSACGSDAPAAASKNGAGTSLSVETPTPSETETAEDSVAPSESPSPSESGPDASASPKTSKDPNLKTFNGYLLDQKCGKDGEDTKGNSMKEHPEKHTVKCLKKNADSGYGMAIRQKDGTYKFYKFDKEGSQMVKHSLVDKTVKTDEMKIAVRGTLKGSTITVKLVLAYGLK
jgi:hypothetical protein